MSVSFVDLSKNSTLYKKFGIEAGWRFGMYRTARFGDLDALAHLNHTSYLRYFEDCRLQYLIHHGLTNIQNCSPDHPTPVLLGLEIKYLSPVHHCDELFVTTRCIKIGNTSMTLEYAAWKQGCAAWCTSPFVLMIPSKAIKWKINEKMKESIVKFEPNKVAVS